MGLQPDRDDTPRAFSVDTMRWDGFDLEWAPEEQRDRVLAHHDRLIEVLRSYAEACSYAEDRAELSRRTDDATVLRVVEHAG